MNGGGEVREVVQGGREMDLHLDQTDSEPATTRTKCSSA